MFERLNHNLLFNCRRREDAVPCNAGFKKHRALESAMHNAPVSLNIGSCNTVGASFLYPLLAEFKKLSPDIHISAEISNTQTLTEKILNSSLDLAIVPETVQQILLSICRFDDDIVVICWPGIRWKGVRQRLKKLPEKFL